MVKWTICVNRKPGMGIEEFHDYWRNHHGALYKTLPFVSKYIRKYNQCHTIPEAYQGGANPPFDGVAELWFDNAAAIDAFLAEPEYLEKVRPDEQRFCDFEKTVFFVTTEEPVLP